MGSGDDRLDDWSLSTIQLPGEGEPQGFTFAIARGLTSGRQIGPYRLVRPLGEGGYAEVWLAIEQGEHGFQKQVALKILKETATDQAALDGLINEARVCGMLHHPRIVDVYGVSRHEEFTFIAMEFVDGTTLEHLLQKVALAGLQLPLSVVIDIAIGVAEALDHAHTAKGPDGAPLRLVHRDLKPGNVMLSRGAGVKVTDFGLAKATTSRNVTQAGQVRGTPGYIAPEVWGGTRSFTAGVDLWALGVMIWEMVVNEHLFEGTIIEVMSQAMNGDVNAEIGRLAALRPKLARVTRKLLERDPEQRTQTAWEVVVELRELREKLDAPGGLELFLDLWGGADRKGASGMRRRVMRARDKAWTQLISLAELSSEEAQQLLAVREEARARRKAARAARPRPPKRDTPVPPEGGRRALLAWSLGGVAVAFLVLIALVLRAPEPEPAPPPDEAASGDGVAQLPDEPTPAEPVVAEPMPAVAEPTPAAPAEETPAPRAERTPAPPAPRAPAPAPAPRTEPTPAPAPAPAPAPEPEPTPAPAAEGCVVFQSFPPGADVTLDGAPSGLTALSGESARRSFAPGAVTVAMGSEGATLATTRVDVVAGQKTVVRCELIGASKCTVRAVAGGCP